MEVADILRINRTNKVVRTVVVVVVLEEGGTKEDRVIRMVTVVTPWAVVVMVVGTKEEEACKVETTEDVHVKILAGAVLTSLMEWKTGWMSTSTVAPVDTTASRDPQWEDLAAQ